MSTPVDTNENTATLNQNGSESQQSVDFEKRFKDTQSAYTKSQQALKAANAKLAILEQLTQPQIELDAATQKELDDLKFSDPDAWRAKMNNLELEAKRKHQTVLSEAEKQAAYQAELDRRAQVLEEYNASHPTMPITDEVIQYDVPARITKRLESGEITFDEYLQEVHNFIYTPKTVGTPNKTLGQPNLGNLGGGNTPGENSGSKDFVDNYKNMTLL